MRLRAELQRTGATTTGFPVPDEFVGKLGGGGRPRVVVVLNGFTFRSSIAKMGGSYWLGVSAERREAAGVSGGETYDVEVELDAAPREIEAPDDLRAALAAEPAARDFWATLSFSNQRYHVDQLTGAKTAETRARRLAKSIALLSAGKVR
ncbi:YdeI/OmpD-associated family protein [Paractinoplanes hotanensis]|uniref:YdeI/OmpD-associated family protein n=1 Tax=Paractinoplanes hotanensis TaxID=2906497 RepID=A0ABT0YAU2_9ACTN|nr:YdeI/OmpD-associated family protein [Actinoplanes hotanensis]MCM4083156.1 YdeI/OmpD-associated family protein [Actinoplanes hotanensis]